jgi:hypothetical protein
MGVLEFFLISHPRGVTVVDEVEFHRFNSAAG